MDQPMKLRQTVTLAAAMLVGMAGARWCGLKNGSGVPELCANTNKGYEACGEAALFFWVTGVVKPASGIFVIRASGHLVFALLLLVGISASDAYAENKSPTKKERQEECDFQNRECLDWCTITKSSVANAAAGPNFLQNCNLGCSQPWLDCIKNIKVQAPPTANQSEITSQSMHPIKSNPRLTRTTSAALPNEIKPGASSARWAIQLASVRNPNEVKAEWRRLLRKFKNVLKGKKLTVVRAHLGERGIFYRLRIAGFQHKRSAITTCASIKTKGGNCLAILIPRSNAE